MVMSVQELKKENEKYRSQIVRDNVEAIFQNCISVAMKKGEGETTLKEYQVEDLTGKKEIGEEEIQYFETLGYDIFQLNHKKSCDVKYIIAWSDKSKIKNNDQVHQDIFRCKRTKIILTVLFLAYSIIILYCWLANALIEMWMIGGVGLIWLSRHRKNNQKIFPTSKYLYVTRRKE